MHLRQEVQALQSDVKAFQAASDNLIQKLTRLQSEASAAEAQDDALVRERDREPTAKGHTFIKTNEEVPEGLKSFWRKNTKDDIEASKSINKSRESVRTTRPPSNDFRLTLDVTWRNLYIANENETKLRRKSEKTIRPEIYNRAMTSMSGLSDTLGDTSAMSLLEFLLFCLREALRAMTKPLKPYSRSRTAWDFFALLVLLQDAIVIPLVVAWDMPFVPGEYVFDSFVMSAVFWTLDVMLSFNTAYMDNGALVTKHRQIASRYLRTWFSFDLLTIVLDYLLLLNRSSSLGVVRVLRLLRTWRMGSIASKIEDRISLYEGGDGILLVLTICKILVGICLTAHTLGCIWFFLGYSAWRRDQAGWFDSLQNAGVNVHTFSLPHQYIIVFKWALAHILAAPTDQNMLAVSMEERGVVILFIFTSVFVLGCGLSAMSSTISNLNAMHAKQTALKQQLSRYLHGSSVSEITRHRIIKTAMLSFQRQSSRQLDMEVLSLLSEQMATELKQSPCKDYLVLHPLWSCIDETTPEVVLDICSSCKNAIYAENDVIFSAGHLSEQLYISTSGTFHLDKLIGETSSLNGTYGQGLLGTLFHKPQFFCEVSLFARVKHRSTLTAKTFAEASTITAAELAQSVRRSPHCIGFLYHYGQACLNNLAKREQIGEVDELEVPLEDWMPPEVVDKLVQSTRKTMFPKGLDAMKFDRQRGEFQYEDFTSQVLTGNVDSMEELKISVLKIFPELDPVNGLYTVLDEDAERKRAICSILCVSMLITNRYEDFVSHQSTGRCMSRELWEQMRTFLTWVDLEPATLHALFVLLAVRSLGKMSGIVQDLDLDPSSAEDATVSIIDAEPQLAPSAQVLAKDMYDRVIDCLGAFSIFHFGQFLQGEITPWHLHILRERVEEQGEDLLLLKFYLVAMWAIMCGIRGSEIEDGSLFMDEENGRNVMEGITSLIRLCSTSTHSIYWSYIESRGAWLGLNSTTPAHYALARLTCLTRCTTSSDLQELVEAWDTMSHCDRIPLAKNFLADGITDEAFVFVFLPLYFANARRNHNVGLHRALVVLLGVIEVLQVETIAVEFGQKMVSVDFRDLAQFASQVTSSNVFEACPSHLKVVFREKDIQVSVSTPHWHRAVNKDVKEEDSLGFVTTHMLTRLVKKTADLERALEAKATQAGVAETLGVGSPVRIKGKDKDSLYRPHCVN